MKKLVFAALLCGSIAQMGTGCIFVTEDGDSEGVFQISWQLVAGDENAPAACPPEADTIQLNSLLEGSSEPIIDLYTCANGKGATAPLPFGNYTVWVNLLTPDGALYAQSAAQNAVLSPSDTGPVPVVFEMSLDRGFFGFQWAIVNPEGTQVTCDEAGAGEVSALSTVVADPNSFYEDLAPCTEGFMFSRALPLLRYTIAMQLLNAEMLAISEAVTEEAELTFGNEFLDLGPITLQLLP